MNTDDIEVINQSISNTQKQIMKLLVNHGDYSIVILIGITGAGKTTVSSILSRKKVMIRRPEDDSKIILECNGIQFGGKSITEIPNIMFNQEDKVLFADCPGFLDTNGSLQEIINAFTIDFLLESFSKTNNRITVLLVVSAAELESARTLLICQDFDRIEKMFPNQQQLEKSIGIIITKAGKDRTPISYIRDLNVNASARVQKWCQFFINNPDKVFSLPKPSKKNINQEYVLLNREQIMEFLKRKQTERLTHQIALGEKASNEVCELKKVITKHIKKKVNSIFDSIDDICRKEVNLEELAKWSELLSKFTKVKIQNIKDLIDTFQTHIPDNSRFTEYINELKEFEELDIFINRIIKTSHSDIEKSFRKKAATSISNIGTFQEILIQKEQLKAQGKIIEDNEVRTKILEGQLHETQSIAEKRTKDLEDKLQNTKIIAEKDKNELKKKLQELEESNKRQKEEHEKAMKKTMEETNKLMDKIKNYDITVKLPMTKLIKIKHGWQQVYSRPYLDEKELYGILQYLTDEAKGNIHKNGIIQISSNSILNSYSRPENIVNFNNVNEYNSRNIMNSYIHFDFLDYEVQIESYLIRTTNNRHLKNWVLEGSNDNNEWTNIDTRTNCAGLNSSGVRCVFIPYTDNTFYHYIRLRQTGVNWGNDYQIQISFMEFYGKLHKI